MLSDNVPYATRNRAHQRLIRDGLVVVVKPGFLLITAKGIAHCPATPHTAPYLLSLVGRTVTRRAFGRIISLTVHLPASTYHLDDGSVHDSLQAALDYARRCP